MQKNFERQLKAESEINFKDKELIFNYFFDLEKLYKNFDIGDVINQAIADYGNDRYNVYAIFAESDEEVVVKFDATTYNNFYGIKLPYEQELDLTDSKYMYWEENKEEFFRDFIDEYLKKNNLYNKNILSKIKKEMKLAEEKGEELEEIYDSELEKIVEKMDAASEKYVEEKIIELVDEYVENNSSDYLIFERK